MKTLSSVYSPDKASHVTDQARNSYKEKNRTQSQKTKMNWAVWWRRNRFRFGFARPEAEIRTGRPRNSYKEKNRTQPQKTKMNWAVWWRRNCFRFGFTRPESEICTDGQNAIEGGPVLPKTSGTATCAVVHHEDGHELTGWGFRGRSLSESRPVIRHYTSTHNHTPSNLLPVRRVYPSSVTKLDDGGFRKNRNRENFRFFGTFETIWAWEVYFSRYSTVLYDLLTLRARIHKEKVPTFLSCASLAYSVRWRHRINSGFCTKSWKLQKSWKNVQKRTEVETKLKFCIAYAIFWSEIFGKKVLRIWYATVLTSNWISKMKVVNFILLHGWRLRLSWRKTTQ